MAHIRCLDAAHAYGFVAVTPSTDDAPQLTTRGMLVATLALGIVFGVYRLALQWHSAHVFLVAVGLLMAAQAYVMDWLRRYLQPHPRLWILVPLLSAIIFLSLAGFAIATLLRGV